MGATLSDYDLIDVAVNDEIRIVCDDNNLSALLRFHKAAYKFFKNGSWIQVFFGLVDDQWTQVVSIDGKIKEQ